MSPGVASVDSIGLDEVRHGGGRLDLPVFRAGPGVTWIVDAGTGAADVLLERLAGVRPADGTRVWNGQPAAGAELSAWQRRTTLVPDRPWEAGHLSVVHSLRLAALLWEVPAARERIGREISRWGLAGIGRRRLAELSGGERRRVLLAASLVPDPLVWLVAGGSRDLDAPGQVVWSCLLTRVHFGLPLAPRIAVVTGELCPALANARIEV